MLIATNIQAQLSEKPIVYQVGAYKIYMLTENQSNGNAGILIDVPQEILEKYIPDGTFPNAVHAVLITKNDEVWLVDTGFGRNIFKQMEVVGIMPENVNHVILTHLHGDHIGGMLRDKKPAFPSADITLSEKEYDYWISETEMLKLPENNRGNFKLAQNVLQVYGAKVKRQDPISIGEKFSDGIHILDAYGHTPGHVMCLIKDKTNELLIWGDLTHAMAIQMPHPEIAVTYDNDPNLARESRLKVLKYVSENEIPIAGMHVPFSGIGTVKKDKNSNGYIFEKFSIH